MNASFFLFLLLTLSLSFLVIVVRFMTGIEKKSDTEELDFTTKCTLITVIREES